MKDTWRRRLSRRNLIAVVLAALVFLATGLLDGLYERVIGTEAWDYNFENVDVGVGEWVDVDGMRGRVVEYRSAYRVSEPTGNKTVANGIYLVVTVRADRPGPGMDDLAELWAYQDGLELEMIGGQGPIPSVGFGQTGQVYFDVDPEHLPGTRVLMFQKEVTFRYRTRAVVDLGIDEAKAAELRAVSPDEVVEVARTPMEALR